MNIFFDPVFNAFDLAFIFKFNGSKVNGGNALFSHMCEPMETGWPPMSTNVERVGIGSIDANLALPCWTRAIDPYLWIY
ncbi:hypothetical protein DSCW_56100 [Desulfosarcina widdelii]|uniref:Uncharacterized protein n=1 Tax=Desulfosarcina widdelii TaxID=947919 RepID=A0A5K7ZEP7_9BACT|nr:hypothetical protein DSCW_56100 [Desulfosarcina widdelii]